MSTKPVPLSPRLDPPRWRRRPEERPRQILEAAFKVFGDQGLHQATLDDVAREAGITKGTIYLYFPGKAALFSAMLKSRVTDILLPMESAEGDRERPIGPAELAAFGRRLYRFMQSPAYLTVFRTIVGEAARFPEAAEELFRDGILVANRRMGAVLARGISAGRFRDVDPLVASRAFAGMFLVFAVSQRLLGGGRIHPIPEATVVTTVIDLFLHGLLQPQPPGARRRRLPVDGAGGPRRASRRSSPTDPATAPRSPGRIAAGRRARRSAA